MRFEALAVISVTVWCHVLQSVVSVLQRGQYIALKQKLPTKLHGIKCWSSVCLRRIVQCFLMLQRNVLCLHIQDDWIWLRMMLKYLESGNMSLELLCRTLPRILTNWSYRMGSDGDWTQIWSPRRQRQQILLKLWNRHHATWCKNSGDCHLSNTCHANLITCAWHYIPKTVVIGWGTDLLWYIRLVTCSVGQDIPVFPALVYVQGQMSYFL